MRSDGRKPGELRPVTIHRNYLKYAGGSVMIEVGDTRLICTASLEDKVPRFSGVRARVGLPPNTA